MAVFRVPASTLTKDIEQLIHDNPRTRQWRTNVNLVRERVTVRAAQSERGPHNCWVEFLIQESVTSSVVSAKVCQSAHDAGRARDHVLRELGIRYR